MVVCTGFLIAHSALSVTRPANETDYEGVGSYAATVTRVYQTSVEIQTDGGASLLAPVSMVPEGAAAVGSQVTVDVSKLAGRSGIEIVKPGGGVSPVGGDSPIFIASDRCSTGVALSCAQAFGDTGGDDVYYAVTSVRVDGLP